MVRKLSLKSLFSRADDGTILVTMAHWSAAVNQLDSPMIKRERKAYTMLRGRQTSERS
jgi:hypothetical protein